MRKTCRVTIHGRTVDGQTPQGQVFSAFRGDILLDAASKDGADIPYDCRSGRCGVCRVRVLDGLAVGGECREPGTVRACQARIMSDLHLQIEALPDVQTVAGRVSAITPRGPDVVEVLIAPSAPLVYLPGQYLHIEFRGFSPRSYAPSAPMEDFSAPEFLHLQVQGIVGGDVSAALGSAIREGHPVRIKGPFGTAFLRPWSESRLVLASSGAGFAPVWSIAVAALRENQRRRIVIVAGARTLQSLYMVKALCLLARFPNVTVIPVVQEPERVPEVIRIGGVADYVPRLSAEDAVHVAGPPLLVEAVSRIAAATGTPCCGIPFVPAHGDEPREEIQHSSAPWRRGDSRSAV
jgi:3-phenylpropionate/trans-cinnamate dioxygenase ferredoxin reductase subunit